MINVGRLNTYISKYFHWSVTLAGSPRKGAGRINFWAVEARGLKLRMSHQNIGTEPLQSSMAC